MSDMRVANGGGMAVQKRWPTNGWKHRLPRSSRAMAFPRRRRPPPATRPTPTPTPAPYGLLLPSTEIAIRDDDNNDVKQGGAGEICIRGPQVMAGYWQRPDETAKVFAIRRLLQNRRHCVMDERGYVKIVDRKKDMVLVSGFNVYPNEVEDVVASCPGVLECAVIGVPDEKIRQKRSGVHRQERPEPHRAAGTRLLRSQPRRVQKTSTSSSRRRPAQNASKTKICAANCRDMEKKAA